MLGEDMDAYKLGKRNVCNNKRVKLHCEMNGSRLTPWLLVWGVYCVSLVFPALDTDYKKMLSFGIWKETDVGYNKTAPPPYE
ncbi:hypothetical protein YYG_03631 [Plasmodium vinckei petteri]|uniref:Uncharacterized protein n=1 Tax=Plasmodium vinckei petteri TaxID=138298 RepID=W7AGY7_PLAVN|nr:hypothetical protein YYG_03631 [Plasmodium vinckei petteri]